MMMMSSGKSSYFMFFGIVFGLCLGLVIRNHRALEIVKRCDTTASDRRKLLLLLLLFGHRTPPTHKCLI